MGNRVLLCDDDPLLRSVVRRLTEDAGWVVVAETDTSEEAVIALGEQHVDLVILDLALRAGNGEELLARLTGDDAPRVVVFSAYIGDADKLFDRGAAAVIEKPDFTRLEEVITRLLERPEGSVSDRRRPPERPLADLPRPTGLTLSGFEAWTSFRAALDALLPGDAVLALDVAPDAAQRDIWDDVFRTDYRVAVARAAGAVRRLDERVSLSPTGYPVMIIVGGHMEAAAALFGRLERAWQREVDSGTPIGAFGHVGPDSPPGDVLDRVLAALAGSTPDLAQPLRMV